MSIYFSASTSAFYDTQVWSNDLPVDAVEIDPVTHTDLLQALTEGHVIVANDNGHPEAVSPPPLTPILLASKARRLRDDRIAAVRWLIDRHRDETALGLTTALTGEDYRLVLQYVQLLRDLPEQDGFPGQIEWPELPMDLIATGE